MPMPGVNIDIKLEDMKVAVRKAINELEVEEYIKKEAEKAVENFDFEAEVKRVVHTELQEQVQNYFRYGQGSKAIKNSIEEAFNTLKEEEK